LLVALPREVEAHVDELVQDAAVIERVLGRVVAGLAVVGLVVWLDEG
jgi:hypothetical protein